MLPRTLRLLWRSPAKRITHPEYHSLSHTHKVNLTISYTQTICNLKRFTFSPSNTLRMQSNLSIAADEVIQENNNNVCPSAELDINNKYQTETQFMYNVLTSSDKYKKTVLPFLNAKENIPDRVIDEILAKNYDDYTITEILEDFKILSHYYAASKQPDDKPYSSKLFDLVLEGIPDLIDDQLWDLMNHMQLWFPIERTDESFSFFKIITKIDDALCDRIKDFTIDEMMIGCDLMYRLRRPRCKFVSKAIEKIAFKSTKLSPASYVHYMFILNVTRTPSINMYELEYALESIISDITGDEIGIIALAFFKTRTPIRNLALLEKIINKCIERMDQLNELTICAVMKVTRYSMHLDNVGIFKKLFRAFSLRIDKMSTPTLMHAGHAAASILAYEKDIIDNIIKRFEKMIPTARAKDLERMLFLLTAFNYPKTNPCYNLILNELKNPAREAEYRTFYHALAASVMYLTTAGIYPLDIISKMMDLRYLGDTYNHNSYNIGIPYLVIETSLRIEVPEYEGPLLPLGTRQYLVNKFGNSFSKIKDLDGKVPANQKFLFDVVKHAKILCGSEAYVIEQLLPHYKKSDITFCLDSRNNFVPPQSFKRENPEEFIKYAPKIPEGYKWIVLCLTSHNHTYRDSFTPSGVLAAKMRLLEKIGYTPRILFARKWVKLRTRDDKMNYLSNVLLGDDVNDESMKNMK